MGSVEAVPVVDANNFSKLLESETEQTKAEVIPHPTTAVDAYCHLAELAGLLSELVTIRLRSEFGKGYEFSLP